MTNSEPKLPQLHMRYSFTGPTPVVDLPSPYALRTLTPADQGAWADLLQRNGDLGNWDAQRAAPFFAPDGPMPLQSAFVATYGDTLVATAHLHLHRSDAYAPTPELSWVAVDPAHKGKGLGRAVCAAVLQAAATAGYPDIFLLTDDWRHTAIRIYLGLGFVPWYIDASAQQRWQAFLNQQEQRT
jgi:mycothiol synthase